MRLLTTLAVALAALPAFAETPCPQLGAMKLHGGTITSANAVSAGTYKSPSSNETVQMPAACRVTATLQPTADSKIEIEVWLPENWNGKYEAIGGGGWGGEIRVTGMAAALAEGYATSATDTGHKGGDATFAPGHPEKLIDYSYRAVHEMALAAKALISARYGRAPKVSYWNGCSYGGRQALEEAQRYPGDFDGILAGAPANYHTHLHSFDMKVALVNQKDEAHLVPQNKLALLHSAVLAACDSLDGVKDGLIGNPLKCKFDPVVLTCKGADTPDCLTAAQVETVVTMYAPAQMKDGTLIYPGMPFGSESGWTRLTAKGEPLGVWLGDYRYVLNEDPAWDWRKFVLDRDVPAVDAKAPYLNAINADLRPFHDRGGKLLMYHGWADHLISAENTINYLKSVETKMGGTQDAWLRLFMVPGMMHCRGGEGPSQFNGMAALERWVESKEPPAQIVVSRVVNNTVDMTRPLCPYPQQAVYKGVGSTNDAANFSCRVP